MKEWEIIWFCPKQLKQITENYKYSIMHNKCISRNFEQNYIIGSSTITYIDYTNKCFYCKKPFPKKVLDKRNFLESLKGL